MELCSQGMLQDVDIEVQAFFMSKLRLQCREAISIPASLVRLYQNVGKCGTHSNAGVPCIVCLICVCVPLNAGRLATMQQQTQLLCVAGGKEQGKSDKH